VLDLSPTKLIIIFVVVVVLLGPKRLPEVARQLGAGWRRLRELHLQFDRELRQSMPDLPSSQEIVRFARSPVTLLNQLADRHGNAVATDPEATDGATAPVAADADADAPSAPGWDERWERTPGLPVLDVDDPNLN
jgi:sec-independent protein translocase protein TatB